jgi:Ca-activated chloride channel family protein
LRPLLFAARIIGLGCLVVALARPQSGREIVDVSADGVDIMLLLDVSSSMQARDLGSANRLEVAREVVARFIEGRRSDRIGMVVFAAESFTQCPLTLDYDVLLQFLGDIRIAEQSWDGTAIGMAMINATNRLRETGRGATNHGAGGSRVAILLTDGVNNAGEIDPQTAADVAAAVRVRFYTIGIGAEQRGQRRRGGVDFDEEALRQIAEATGGKYYHANSSEKLAEIYDEIGRLETTEVTSRIHLQYSERYAGFLWPGLLLLLAEFILRQTRMRSLP